MEVSLICTFLRKIEENILKENEKRSVTYSILFDVENEGDIANKRRELTK